MSIAIVLLLGAATAAVPQGPDTLRLSLQDAVAEALQGNPALLASRAEADAASAQALSATRAFLPTLELHVGGVHTTDPVGAFGLKLRQERFQPEDLALDALNRPEAYGGFSSSATVTVPLLVPEGLFGHAAARRVAAARRAMSERMAGATTYQVIDTYWSAQLAARHVEALDTALAAARAHVARAEALRTQGMVTGLDARLARLQQAALEVRRLGAVAAAANARQALATMIGMTDSVTLQLTDSLTGTFSTTCAVDAAGCQLDRRADLEAAEQGAGAAAAAVRSAWGKSLPSVALFGTAAQHASSSPWGAGSGDWTVGFMVRWNVLQGLGGYGAVREAQANRAAAEARREAVRAQAQLEAASARRFLTAAAEGVEVAAVAYDEARVALDQAKLRYQQGQAPITELLDVQAATTAAHLTLLSARRDLFVARAALDFSYGVFDR